MISKHELQQYLIRLSLSIEETAQLLSVTPRTVRRWLDGEEIPGPAEQAIRAWIKLHDQHLPWRPDSASVVDDDQKQIALHRANAINLADLLARVEARGGARLAWTVDLDRGTAVLGPVHVSFYRLQNGSFSLASYRRSDSQPDAERDREIIEDAAYCIAQALKKKDPNFGPVVLVVQDGPAKGRTAIQRTETFRSNKEAIQRVCQQLGSPGFHDPFITTESPTELLWDPLELRRECERRTNAPPALAALAAYVKQNSAFFVRNGPRMFSPAETTKRQQKIEALADRLAELAEKAREGLVDYSQFDLVLGELHVAAFFPEGELVAAVTRALVRK